MIKKAIVAALLFGSVPVGGALAAEAYLVHGIDGADLGLETALPVDVSLDGACVAAGVTYTSSPGPAHLDAGLYTLEIRLADDTPCAGPIAATTLLPVNFGENFTLVAHLTDAGSITTTKFVNDIRAPESGAARLIVRHTADAPLVDVLADGAPLFTDLANGQQVSATPPAAIYSVSVAPAGTGVPVIGPVDLPLGDGTVTAVHAVGSASGETLNLILVDLTP
ncbi:DUF4397 domain-containing protein [Thiocapsa bogorovii]|uniref:DUF4397 domain-containing protein n=1 Tax=Thiocapsa bogorovii TaxID=521689 RepID=UPI001E3BFCE2|nr:DUF4397 domain-containing protein [Thiocapsa bogorovii]UHD17993.1 DUF4397 domain-containing protein [Thiocapsa bogorovii]